MVFKRHKIVFALVMTLVLAVAVTAAIFVTRKEREDNYKGTLVWTYNQEVAA